ncbi:hypothetical protein [Pedosphaera parvula]|uniref:DUF5666 domain-containing protein n=1 Tax=Pedosphaera parvula (strain Ellin514) TaxID=320771 RepID=B9XQL7_PEDPL|nr:hypothetical protein [Pedosphaera parvula]EEF57867.1 hypothetical protein Cflav_PD0931 [Pedosphaera parvula Ellin514]
MKRKALYMAAVLGFAVAVPQFAIAREDPSSSSSSDKSSSSSPSSSSSDKSSSGGTGASSSSDSASSSSDSKPGVVMADMTEWQATIQSIDKKKRKVTLKTPDGETKTVKLDKRVKNFDQLQTGDQVKVKALDAVAIMLTKPGEAPATAAYHTARVAPPGNAPAAVMTETVEKTATVEAIDQSNRTLTLKSPEGTSIHLKVDPAVKEFDQLKQGDQVAIVQTQAVAVEVTKPEAQGGTGSSSSTNTSGSSSSQQPK